MRQDNLAAAQYLLKVPVCVLYISFVTIGSGVSIYAVIPALLYAGIQVIQKQILSFHQNKNKMEGLLFCRYMQE
jgi:hypothetical protein